MAGSIIAKTLSQDVIAETVQPLYIGGVNPNGSDAKLTVNTDGTMTGASALALPSLTVASKPVVNSLLAEYTVTGSAVTSIDFSGLDINTHKSYRIEFEIIDTGASAGNLVLFINNDTTQTSYYTQQGSVNANVFTGSRDNMSSIAWIEPSLIAVGEIVVSKTNGFPTFNSQSNFSSNSGVQIMFKACRKTATVTNITQLTFTSSVANAIGVGSTIRIYRGDV